MYDNAKLEIKIVAVRQLVSRGICDLVIVSVGYGSNNRLRVWERVESMVCYSHRQHFHQSLLPAIQKFTEYER